jgi:hypothetical protein
MVSRMSAWLAAIDTALRSLMAPLAALLLALCVLRMPELVRAWGSGTPPGLVLAQWWRAEAALLRWVLLWCLLAAPLLWITQERRRLQGFAGLSALVLLVQAALQYHQALAGAALGADLFAYSLTEILTTGRAAASLQPWPILLAALLALALLLWLLGTGRHALVQRMPAGLASLLCVGALWGQVAGGTPAVEVPVAMQNKLAFFLDDVTARWSPARTADPYVSTAYPFAHAERTPDTLGPLLRLGAEKPNFVFLIVEGLGRSFSGPGARSGSFTPFLDELAARSLYWENFLATQGRTFAVLPSVFGSLPFAQEGFNALGASMPRHDSLLSLLKEQGYALRYYTGTGLGFDAQGDYLQREGVSGWVSETDFHAPERKLTEWGYADRDLLQQVAAREPQKTDRPFVAIVQTMSMHSPFEFPERSEFEQKVLTRLDELGIPKARQTEHLQQRRIFASILYTDDAIRRFFQQMSGRPAWNNTIVLITGDHRLPELDMQHRLERYHVPLIVSSPMLTGARSFRSVSSHFDIAPSLLAMLSNRYGMATPAVVSWMGSGLDTEPGFRNVHDIPLQQTKTGLHDFVSGEHHLALGRLSRLSDGLQAQALEDPAVAQDLRDRFERFKAANAGLSSAKSLTDPDQAGQRRAYADRPHPPAAGRAVQEVQVTGAQGAVDAAGRLTAQASFTNPADRASVRFVPLLVLSDASGKELAEAYGGAMQLEPGQSTTVTLAMRDPLPMPLGPGLSVSMIVSHPDTGKPVGRGQYRVPLGR